jgi:uncharacterized protein
MPLPPDLPAIRARLAALLPALGERYGVRALAVYGSYARGEQRPDSDLDLLVEFNRTPGLLAFSNLEHYLEQELGVPVDLATRAMIGPALAPGVQADLVGV